MVPRQRLTRGWLDEHKHRVRDLLRDHGRGRRGRHAGAELMTKTVYVHIGLPKTGTSYLQQCLRHNRDDLTAIGWHLPGHRSRDQRHAVWDLLGRRIQGSAQRQVAGAWQRLVDEIASSPAEHCIVSEEFLVHARPAHVRQVTRALSPRELHVVVTVRDLGRVMSSMWQQNTAKARTVRWSEFVSAVRDPEHGPATSGVAFWLRYDLARVLDTWGVAVPPERIHIVTVPPAGTGPEVLWARFCSATGMDAGALRAVDSTVHPAVDAVQAETLRRLNSRLGGRLSEQDYLFMMSNVLRPSLRGSTDGSGIAFPPDHREWLMRRCEDVVQVVQGKPYHVVGDVDDLRSKAEVLEGENPDDVADAAVAATAMTLLAATLEHYAATRSTAQRRGSSRPAVTSLGSRMSSFTRSLSHQSKVRALELADHNRLVARLASAYLRRSSASKS